MKALYTPADIDVYESEFDEDGEPHTFRNGRPILEYRDSWPYGRNSRMRGWVLFYDEDHELIPTDRADREWAIQESVRYLNNKAQELAAAEEEEEEEA